MTKPQNYWHEKTVFITGASSGIGRALALDVAKRGARVGLIARREELLREVARTICAEGGVADYRIADVKETQAMAGAVGDLEDSVGVCDVAIAGAGVYRKTSVDAFSTAKVQEVFATNVFGVTNLFAAVLPRMLERGTGHVAVIASIAGLLGLPQGGAYSGSKAAVIAMLQSLRLELVPRGIQVTTICPGYVDTAMITDYERRTIKSVVSAEEAARRIARGLERGSSEIAFPWGLWLEARLGGLLSGPLYQFAMRNVAPMEETSQADGTSTASKGPIS
jgi:short-subunit dehydrogenase